MQDPMQWPRPMTSYHDVAMTSYRLLARDWSRNVCVAWLRSLDGIAFCMGWIVSLPQNALI